MMSPAPAKIVHDKKINEKGNPGVCGGAIDRYDGCALVPVSIV
jgi:hypothetical protein